MLASLLLPLVFPVVSSQAGVHRWYAKVKKVQDGDTIYVDIAGDRSAKWVPIRNLGIQATEVHPRLECHAGPARSYLSRILPVGSKVRLSAVNANSTAGRDPQGRLRYWRYVDKWQRSTGTWVDVQAMLLLHGDAIWLVHQTERSRVGRYHRYMQRGLSQRIGIWDDDFCGAGPSAGANLRMWLHYEADGLDTRARNGEWMRIQNRSATDVSLAGWKLRNGAHTFYRGGTYYTFPAGTVVRAGATITVYFGSGNTNVAAGRFYLGVQATNYLPNVSDPSKGYPGKTLYLLDRQLDFRSIADYPCLVSCRAPAVEIATVQYRTTDEYVELRARPGVTTPVDLSGVEVTNDGWTKEIKPGTMLAPGERLRVWCDRGGSDNRLTQFWGSRSGTMLEDSGDTVVLRTAQSKVLDTYRWGRG